MDRNAKKMLQNLEALKEGIGNLKNMSEYQTNISEANNNVTVVLKNNDLQVNIEGNENLSKIISLAIKKVFELQENDLRKKHNALLQKVITQVKPFEKLSKEAEQVMKKLKEEQKKTSAT